MHRIEGESQEALQSI